MILLVYSYNSLGRFFFTRRITAVNSKCNHVLSASYFQVFCYNFKIHDLNQSLLVVIDNIFVSKEQISALIFSVAALHSPVFL